MPSLVVIGGPIHPLPSMGQVVVGRDGVCDIVLARRSVSRHHARFHCRNGEVFVEDLGSNNGTFVNGVRIESETQLADQDRVNLYDVPLQFHAKDFSPDETRDETSTLVALQGAASAERRLSLVLELGRRLGSTLNIAEILPRVLDVLFAVFPQTENGEILLADERGQLVPQAMKHGRADDSSIVTSIPSISEIAQRVFSSGDPELVVDLGDEESVFESDEGSNTICAPLSGPSQGPVGVIELVTDCSTQPFDQPDLELLTVVSLHAGQAIENARTHERLIAHEQRRVQMATARDVQNCIIPRRRPSIPGYEFHDYYSPADLIGGDYFDYIRLTSEHIVITIGDVCGKGLPAALQMAQLARDVRHALNIATSLKAAVRTLNEYTLERDGGLVTLSLCMLDTANHTASFVSAAHPLPLRRRQGRVEPVFDLERGGMPIGVLEDNDWHVTTVDVEAGDEFVIVTDGITEQITDEGWYGAERFARSVEVAAPGVCGIVERVVSDVEAFRGSQTRNDDRCVVAFGRIAADR